ncbi:hypothetical protein [Aliikangiella sp. IMCC44359]|uniref:hypothetical protein n=1 Tax=Aliikangiella sp. IMCC44359 TaxID=3459125 RepID=UPI00403AEFB1
MIKKALLTASMAILPCLAKAELPSFSYVEAGKTDMEHEQVAGDFTGFEATASYQLEDSFYIAGKYVSTNDLDLDMETKTIGIGYYEEIFNNSVVFVQLDAVGVIFSRPNTGVFDEQGYQFSLGFKSNITDSLEVELTLKRLNTGEVDVDYGDYRIDYAVLGLHYMFTDNIGLYADFEKEDNSERTSFGVRYEF